MRKSFTGIQWPVFSVIVPYFSKEIGYAHSVGTNYVGQSKERSLELGTNRKIRCYRSYNKQMKNEIQFPWHKSPNY